MKPAVFFCFEDHHKKVGVSRHIDTKKWGKKELDGGGLQVPHVHEGVDPGDRQAPAPRRAPEVVLLPRRDAVHAAVPERRRPGADSGGGWPRCETRVCSNCAQVLVT